ncbi:radical SAM protein [Chlorobaculum limnaeum]|uniref:radical SAM protein n=1 Tax=Chlorobaculum limnaeum TaxID=274537 RepID=UPI000A002E25|nr:radical SAM protein [Chlorobaculum limnaeum]
MTKDLPVKPELAFLVLQPTSSQLYCIPQHLVKDKRIAEDRKSSYRKEEISYVIDLTNGREFYVTQDLLEIHAIPDEMIREYLVAFSVKGLRRPYRFAPREPFVFHGNLLNPKTGMINLGGYCNSHCRFCYTRWLQDSPDMKTNEAKEIMNRLSRIESIDTLVLTGGEATIRTDLELLLGHAKHLGFSDIGLQTNGRALNSDYVQKLLKAGLSTVLISLHGTSEHVHDKITGVPGSYKATLRAISNLFSASVGVVVNTVICRSNAHELNNMPNVLGDFVERGVTWRLSYPILEGDAYVNRQELLIRFSKLNRYLVDTLPKARRIGMKLQAGTMPLCISKRYELHNTYTTNELLSLIVVSPFYNHNIVRGEVSVKFRACSACTTESLCRGIQIEYLKMFPDAHKEFRPI